MATFTPTSPLAAGTTYTVTISGAKDSTGETMLAPYTYTFTTSQSFDAGGKCPCAIWPDVAPSGISDATDAGHGEPGRQVHPLEQRLHHRDPVLQGAGQHSARTPATLWSSTGTLLATGTFSNESTEGWEQLNFSSPVSVTAGTTYVASYSHQRGSLRVHVQRVVVAGDQRAAVGGGQRRRLRIWPCRHVPVEQQLDELLGRRGVHDSVGHLLARR